MPQSGGGGVMQPPGTHLAQLNVGRLRADPDHPRVRDFVRSIDRINGLGKRSPGFVWMMEGSGAPNAGNLETAIGGDPRFISNLTVWRDAESLEHFVFNTVHRQFYERRADWFETLDQMHLAMWWVPQGHRPGIDEALARLEHLQTNGTSDHAFGWSYLKDARLWRSRGCAPTAAE